MKTTSAAHGGGLLLHPTPKSHRFPIHSSLFLFIPHQPRNSAVPKQLILHPLILCRSRRWDSNAETFRTQNFNFNEDEDDEEEDDDDGEGGFFDFIDEFLDSIWILKVPLFVYPSLNFWVVKYELDSGLFSVKFEFCAMGFTGLGD